MSKVIAETILKQLGGANRLSAMIGAKNFVIIDNGVGFKYPTGKYVQIKLNGKDLYDVNFKSIRGTNIKDIKTFNDVYFDELIPVFENHSKLYLTL